MSGYSTLRHDGNLETEAVTMVRRLRQTVFAASGRRPIKKACGFLSFLTITTLSFSHPGKALIHLYSSDTEDTQYCALPFRRIPILDRHRHRALGYPRKSTVVSR